MAGNIPGMCITGNPNTGNERCAKKERETIGLILTDPAARYPFDAETFNSELNGYIVTNGIRRIYPISDVLGIDSSGGDTTTSDIGFSGTRPIRTSQVVRTYQIEGGDCLYKELSKFNGKQMRLFRVDADQYIYGTAIKERDADYFAGFLGYVWVRSIESTGTDEYQFYLEFYYSNKYDTEKQNMHAFPLSEIPQGLIAVRLESVTGTPAGAKVVANCSGTDYTSEYGEDWEANMFINASGVAAESVVFNESTGLLTITPTGTYRVADAAVLQSGGIYGLTGIPLN